MASFQGVLPILGLTVFTVSCTTIPEPAGQYAPIPLTKFVDSLKCEYADFVTRYKGTRLDIKGWPVTGTMELNTVQTFDRTVGFTANLVPYQGAKVSLAAGNQTTRKGTTHTTIPFKLEPKLKDSSICLKIGDNKVTDGMGFGAWLWGVANSLDMAAGGEPKFGATGLKYQLIFSVDRKDNGSAGVGLEIIPLSLSATALAERNDVQTIEIDLTPNMIVIGHDKKGKPIKAPNIHEFAIKPNPQLHNLLPSENRMLVPPS